MWFQLFSELGRFTALFPGPSGWAGARRELLDFVVRAKINRGRHTDHPAGRHSIRTNQCPPPPSPILLQAGFPSCRPSNSVKALKATYNITTEKLNLTKKRLLGSFICVRISLCTIVAHNTAQNRVDNFPLTLQTNVTEKESNQKMLYFFPPHLTSSSALPGEIGSPEIATFHLNAVCCCQKNTRNTLPDILQKHYS